MIYCTTAVPTALSVALVKLNVEETLPGFMGYRSTRSVVRIDTGPDKPIPARNKMTSGAARLVPESTTQPHTAVVENARAIQGQIKSSLAFSIGNFRSSFPCFLSGETPMLLATRAKFQFSIRPTMTAPKTDPQANGI